MQSLQVTPHVTRRALLAAVAAPWAPDARASTHRHALVVGNADYPQAPLRNAVSDARAISAALRTLGFAASDCINGDRSTLLAAIRDSSERLRGGSSLVLFYFAGHAMQLSWRNFLLPVDAAPKDSAGVQASCVDMQGVLDAYRQAGAKNIVVVLDACRDNPFSGATNGRGLAPLDAPVGSFLAYATSPGNVAEDGPDAGGHGLYTKHLLAELQRDDARIESIFKRVRLSVRQESQGRQVPWESTSLESEIFLNGSSAPSTAASWAAEKSHWERIKDSPRAADLYDFLRRYPGGGLYEVALARLDRLDRDRTLPQPDRTGTVQPTMAVRFRKGDRLEFVLRDGISGEDRGRNLVTVDKVDGDVAEHTGSFGDGRKGRATLAGAVLADPAGTYDPPYPVIPGGIIQVGQRWSGRTVRTDAAGRSEGMEFRGHILARERIEVRAGVFDTFRHEMVMRFDSGLSRRILSWQQPDWGFPLKMTIETTSPGGQTSSLERELVSRTRGA